MNRNVPDNFVVWATPQTTKETLHGIPAVDNMTPVTNITVYYTDWRQTAA